MQKLTAALLAGAVIAPVVAHADAGNVTIYGRMNVGVEYADNGDVSKTRVANATSRIGFKGNEELGNGLKAIWQVESLVRPDEAQPTDGFATRNSYVGLAGSLGSVKLGRIDSPYKDIGGVLNPFGGTTADFYGAPAPFHRMDVRAKNSVLVQSATVNGVQGQAMWATAENKDSKGLNSQLWGAALTYTQAAVEGGIAYQKHQDADVAFNVADGNEAEGVFAYVSAQFGPARLGVGVDTTTEKTATTSKQRQTGWAVGGTYQVSDAVQLRAAYVVLGDKGSQADSGARQYAAGVYYAFSKRTGLLAYSTGIDNDSAANFNFGVNSLGATVGKDPKAHGVLIMHSF